MAARNKLTHDYKTRQKIQVSQLVNRLSNHALGKEGVDMTPTQVNAARILLGKALPDLQATEHSGPDGGPISAKVEVVLIAGKG